MNSPTIFRTVQSLTPYCLPLCGHSQGPPQFLGTPTNSGTGKATDFFFILVYNYSPLKIFVKRERAHIQDCPIYPQPPVRKKTAPDFYVLRGPDWAAQMGSDPPPPPFPRPSTSPLDEVNYRQGNRTLRVSGPGPECLVRELSVLGPKQRRI